ncbi:MAG TPA: M13-type metalloendopeptidase [Acidimicrobiales bacterium]|nr:M13-type metalloendopeptidase [Acidimicrobiales bacterium]
MTLSAFGAMPLDLDGAVRPQDDLFRHVNGRWSAATPIPPDRARYGAFDELREASERAVREILEAAQSAEAGTELRKVGDLYGAFMDEAAVEARGAAPLAGPLAEVAAITSVPELMRLVGRWTREGVGGFIGLGVEADAMDPTLNVLWLSQAGISLPDESYYREAQFESVRRAFAGHVERMLTLAGLDDAPARAARVVELETSVAAHHWDAVRCREVEQIYNPMPIEAVGELFDSAGAARFADWWGETGLEGRAGRTVVTQPSFVEGVASLLTEERLDAWRDWLAYHVVAGHAPYLSSAFVEENFDFYGRTLSGTPEIRDRWKRAVGFVEGVMGEAIGRAYVERHFPASAKARMDELVAHLVEAYRESITALEWMSEATRLRAIEKLEAFEPHIGFPRKWRDYEDLVVNRDDLIGSVRAAAAFAFDYEAAKLDRPVDREEWEMTPQTVNAYYHPLRNQIVFPAAILQPPFFDETRDDAANFGGIGAVIGHEIGHGFDDQGSKFDGAGRLENWWSDADRAAFEERTKRLIAQYDGLVPAEVPDQHVNGALTVGENIGDLGGLGIAWRAYQLSLGGAEAPVIDGLSGAQRFFLAWAQVWRTKARPEEVRRLLAIDPHSPGQFRCNQIVRNLDPFYEAFGVAEGDGLYLAPSDRVTIW